MWSSVCLSDVRDADVRVVLKYQLEEVAVALVSAVLRRVAKRERVETLEARVIFLVDGVNNFSIGIHW